MRSFTLKEVSKIINVPTGKLRQWEKDFEDILDVKRSKQGARIYTETEIDQLLEIKQMLADKQGKDSVRQRLEGNAETTLEFKGIDEIEVNIELTETAEVPTEVISEPLSSSVVNKEGLSNAAIIMDAIDTYKKNFLNEVREEIKTVVRKEILEEVKKEINKGTYYTVKSLSDSIYKSTENTKTEIQELTNTVEKISEHTEGSLKYLSHKIVSSTIETSEEIYSLSKQLSETTEGLSHYVDITNEEIANLTETLSHEREFYMEEREQYRQEIQQREAAFQQMLVSFRDAAPAKEKKWWKFWI